MAYFRNNTVNLLNLHYAVHAIAMTGGGAFYCVYLLKAGVPLPGVLMAMAAILMGRFLIRPAIVPLAVRVGLRPLVIFGTLFCGLQYLILPYVHGVDRVLILLCAVSSMGDTIYWSTYHAYFAALGDHEHRGSQISVREAITAVIGVISPILAGWVLVTYGPIAAFGVSAATQAASAVPLMWTPDVPVVRRAPGAFRASLSGVRLFLCDGWIQSGMVFVWNIALFLSLKENFLNYGGALAIAAVVGAVTGLLLGRHIDAGGGGRAVIVSLIGLAVVVLVRAASLGHPALAVVANALANVGNCLYTPTLMTAVYNLAKQSPCTLRFHAATEGGWDVGGSIGSLVAAALLWSGASLGVTLLLPLFGITASFVLLRRYYAEHWEITTLEPTDPLGVRPSSEV
ncbi:MAG TPA: MFS transporter [Rhizomicrobium sp.]